MSTIEKIALQEFNINYDNLGKNEKKWCHDEMVNNPKWLQPEWKQPGYMSQIDKWIAGIEPFYNDPQPKY